MSAPSLAGRVLATTRDELTLLTGGQARTVAAPDHDCRPGDLVRLAGDPPSIAMLWRHPTGEFPQAGSDALRLLGGGRWAKLRERADILFRTRQHFRGDGFLEVETPLLVRSPGTEVHIDAVPATLVPRPGALPQPHWLAPSPEYAMKRLLSAGAPPIFQICKVFRDGERGTRHRPEFTMLEWYRPFAGFETLLTDCERWLTALAGNALSYCGQVIDLRPPWPRLSFRDALRERGGVLEPDALSPEQQLAVHVERVEPTLGRERPEFLIDWPIAMASLARPSPRDPGVAERVELFIAGLELANGFGELTDAAEQRARCLAENEERRVAGQPEYPLDEAFLGALEEGMPPSAGIAVGLDRVIMLFTDAESIDEVVAF